MEREEVHCIVSGRVQFVMFRDFVTRKARHLALIGYVRNQSDGTVEVIAQGVRENLEKLLEHLKRGPLLAHVANVAIEWRNPTERFDSFELIR